MLSDKFLKWIDSRHVDPDAISRYQRDLRSTPTASLCLDNFLQDHQARRIAEYVMKEAQYKRVFGLFHGKRPIDSQAFVAAEEDNRMFTYEEAEGVAHEFRMSHNWLSFLRMASLFDTGEFSRYFEILVGRPLSIPKRAIHRHRHDDFLKRHNDAGDDRALCAVLYLTPNWQESDGAEFVLAPPGQAETRSAPSFNRLLVFRPSSATEHYVAPFLPGAYAKARCCLVFWFNAVDEVLVQRASI